MHFESIFFALFEYGRNLDRRAVISGDSPLFMLLIFSFFFVILILHNKIYFCNPYAEKEEKWQFTKGADP